MELGAAEKDVCTAEVATEGEGKHDRGCNAPG